jgi:hypothetical protein
MHLPRRPRAVNLSSIFMVPMVHGCAWVRDVYGQWGTDEKTARADSGYI